MLPEDSVGAAAIKGCKFMIDALENTPEVFDGGKFLVDKINAHIDSDGGKKLAVELASLSETLSHVAMSVAVQIMKRELNGRQSEAPKTNGTPRQDQSVAGATSNTSLESDLHTNT